MLNRKSSLTAAYLNASTATPIDTDRALVIGRRGLLTAMLLSPLMARGAEPCPPEGITIDDGTPSVSVPCGNTSVALRNASNTGIVGAGISEASLVTQGSITYGSTYAGQTITGKRFTGQVDVTGSNVTFRGCLFEVSAGSSSRGLRNNASGTLVEDCTFRRPSGSVFQQILHESGSLIVRRCDISRGENNMSIYASNVTVEDSYLHDSSNASNTSGHRDCIEVYAGSNHIFRRSTLLHPAGETSVINIAPWSGSSSVSNLTIEDCYLDGGGSGTILKDLQSTGSIKYIRVQRCRFGGHTKGDWYQFWNLNDYENSPIVTTEAELQAKPNGILWVDNTYLYTQNSPFGYYNHSVNRDGQAAT